MTPPKCLLPVASTMIQWERMANGNKMFPGKIHRECIATRWLKGFGQRRGELPLHLPHPHVMGVPAGCPTRDAGGRWRGRPFLAVRSVGGQRSAGRGGGRGSGVWRALQLEAHHRDCLLGWGGGGRGQPDDPPSSLGGTGTVRYPEPDERVSDGGVDDDDATGEQLGPAPAVGICRCISAAVVAVRPRHHPHRNGCGGGGRPGRHHPDHQGLRGMGGRGAIGPPPKRPIPGAGAPPPPGDRRAPTARDPTEGPVPRQWRVPRRAEGGGRPRSGRTVGRRAAQTAPKIGRPTPEQVHCGAGGGRGRGVSGPSRPAGGQKKHTPHGPSSRRPGRSAWAVGARGRRATRPPPPTSGGMPTGRSPRWESRSSPHLECQAGGGGGAVPRTTGSSAAGGRRTLRRRRHVTHGRWRSSADTLPVTHVAQGNFRLEAVVPLRPQRARRAAPVPPRRPARCGSAWLSAGTVRWVSARFSAAPGP
jgi:hypothetical protein